LLPRPIQAFFRLEAASALVLLGCAAAALAWANLSHDTYRLVFDAAVTLAIGDAAARFTVAQLVNDGLMTLFFFVVGMEIKRELAVGELRTLPQALLPAIAALGGMLVPAGIFLAFNATGPGAPGWGIPMATDIAFCIGVLTLLGTRVPRGLVVFVTALAIFDDIGGILVIALFYGSGIHVAWLLGAAAVTAACVALSRAHVGSGVTWAIAGGLLWYALHHSGIHATISGVVLGLAIPAHAPPGGEEIEAPLTRFVHALHPWVAFGIMPLFALANSGVHRAELSPSQVTGRVAMGTAAALFLGKQAGIFAFTMAAVAAGMARLPRGTSIAKLLGVSCVAGIGFTVALFIAGLAFPGTPHLLDEAKLGILAGSLVSGVVGALVLRATAPVDAAAREGALPPAAEAGEGPA
jgi:NhaA family Na+:H+ antiporter